MLCRGLRVLLSRVLVLSRSWKCVLVPEDVTRLCVLVLRVPWRSVLVLTVTQRCVLVMRVAHPCVLALRVL